MLLLYIVRRLHSTRCRQPRDHVSGKHPPRDEVWDEFLPRVSRKREGYKQRQLEKCVFSKQKRSRRPLLTDASRNAQHITYTEIGISAPSFSKNGGAQTKTSCRKLNHIKRSRRATTIRRILQRGTNFGPELSNTREAHTQLQLHKSVVQKISTSSPHMTNRVNRRVTYPAS